MSGRSFRSLTEKSITDQQASITRTISEACEVLKNVLAKARTVPPPAPLWLSMVPMSGLTPKFWNTPQSVPT